MADLRENVVEFYENDKQATFSFTQGRLITKIRKLAKEYPDECKILAENKDGSIYGHIPAKWLKVSPPKKRELTEEERDELRTRFARLRENGKLKRGTDE